MKILVLSDTHIPGRAPALPQPVIAAAREADRILHAGDIASAAVLDELGAYAEVVAVCGNVDPPELTVRLPRRRLLTLEGHRIGLVHGDGPGPGTTADRARAAFPDADCIVFGHTHVPLLEKRDGALLLNPGSPTDRRRQPRFSYAWLHVTAAALRAELVFFGGQDEPARAGGRPSS